MIVIINNIKNLCYISFFSFIVFGFFFFIIDSSYAGNNYILLVDHSSSMRNNDPKDIRLDAATLIVDTANDGDYISVIAFSRDAKFVLKQVEIDRYSKNKICKDIRENIPKLKSYGTDIINVINVSSGLVSEIVNQSFGNDTYVILLSDGLDNVNKKSLSYELKQSLNNFMFNEIPINVIALGEKANTSFLKEIANSTFGGYFPVNNGGDLLDIYLKIIISSKGLVHVKSETFDVWDSSKELYIVLFKDKKRSLIDSIQSNHSKITKETYNTYWSRVRKAKPIFYDFIRILNPDSGTWNVQKTGKGMMQIHVLQSAPFEFKVTSPKKDKYLINDNLLFKCVIEPKSGVNTQLYDKLLNNIDVFLTVKNADGVTERSVKLNKEGLNSNYFQTEHSFDKLGDYRYEIVAKFKTGNRNAMDWETNRDGIVFVKESDFIIDIDETKNRVKFDLPDERIEFKAEVKVKGANNSINVLSNRSSFKAKIFDNDGVLLRHIPCEFDYDNISVIIQNRGESHLPPGSYRLEISGNNPDYTIKKDNVEFIIDDWKKPNLNKYEFKLSTNNNETLNVGQEAELVINFSDRIGNLINVNDLIEKRWLVKSIQYEDLQWRDAFGNIGMDKIKKVSNDLSNHFYIKLSHSGELYVSGSVIFHLAVDSKAKTLNELVQRMKFRSSELNVPDKIEVKPEHFNFIIKNLNEKKQSTIVLKTWYPKQKKCKLSLIYDELKYDESKIPENWINYPKEIYLRSNKLGGVQTTNIPIEFSLLKNRNQINRGKNYVGHIAIIDTDSSNNIIAKVKVKLKIIDWPIKEDFYITHEIPETSNVESSIAIYTVNINNYKDLPKWAYPCSLHFKQGGDIIELGSKIYNTFVVKDIKWDVPASTSKDYNTNFSKHKRAENQPLFYVATFFNEGLAEFQLKVKEFVIELKDEDSDAIETRTINNVTSFVQVKVLK